MIMPNYGPTSAPGDTRLRIPVLHGYYRLGEAGSVDFQEQEVVQLADGSETPLRDTRTVPAAYQPGRVIDLRSPVDDAVVGQISHEAIFAAIYSLGRQAQLDADAKDTAP